MTTRSFTAGGLVQLPRLDAASAVSLGAAIESAAKGAGALPPGITKARKALAAAHTRLRDEHSARLASRPASTVEQTAGHLRVHDAWAATFSWLKGFSQLPADLGKEQASAAGGLLSTLFPSDLKFTQLRYRQEWAESDARLRRIDQDGLAQQFDALGGAIFLGAIRKTHADYGRVLGITQASAPEGQSPQLRASLDGFSEALRSYVLKVSAHVEADEPGTAELASKLLAPLDDYESKHASPTPAEPPAEPAGPAEPK